MSSNGQNHQLRPDPDGQEIPEDDREDDDFGDFEGFVGGVERMQAQPAPSPWATFPDLLPVQTSPATPAEDGSSRNAGPREVWHPVANGAHWNGAGPSHEEGPRPMPQQMRTLNPPDVSLGTNQAVGGRVTPDNVHDAALAVVMDHLENGLDARLPVEQLDRLSQQLESAEQSRSLLEEQLSSLRQRNQELELQLHTQIVSSQQQINDLTVRLQRNQEVLEQRLTEMGEISANNWRHDLRQIQEEIAGLRQTQIQARNDCDSSIQNFDELRTGICNKIQTLESNLHKEYTNTETRLTKKFEEQMRTAVETTLQQMAVHLSQAVHEAMQSSNSGDNQQGNLLHSIKEELEKHKDQQKKALDEERQRQLATLTSALQSALQQLNNAMKEKPKDKEGDIS